MTGSGRRGTGNFVYRRNREILLAQNSRCGLCGHDGSQTADHIVSAKFWPRDVFGKKLPGFDDLPNLQPAHGTLAPGKENRCPTCGRLCNQSKGARVRNRPQTRAWGV